MNEASKAAELSSQPTKRGRKAWLIGLAVVVAVVTIVLLASAPKPEPVKVWFVRATNEAGVKKLVFEGTNGMRRNIRFWAFVRKDENPDVKAHPAGDTLHDYTMVPLMAGTNFFFSISTPPEAIHYHVMWEVIDIPGRGTRWERLRVACFRFFSAHSMPRLAACFAPDPERHYIPSTEIKE